MNTVAPAADRKGLGAALVAFAIWGLLPLYLKLLSAVPPLEIMAHRIVWACVAVLAYLALRGQLGQTRRVFGEPRTLAWLGLSATLISLNWWVYVWAVTTGHVIESSLGYFINPLVSVLFGVFLLSERLKLAQWIAVGFAAAGVLWLTWQAGRLPWISLALAMSFALYGLVRKKVAVESTTGLGIETLILLLPCLLFLGVQAGSGVGSFGQQGARLDGLLIASGVVTAVPLVMFAYGVRRVPLSTIGLLQYLAPSLQLLGGIFVFGEPFDTTRAVGFGLVWAGLAVLALDGLWRVRPGRTPVRAAPADA